MLANHCGDQKRKMMRCLKCGTMFNTVPWKRKCRKCTCSEEYEKPTYKLCLDWSEPGKPVGDEI